MRPGPFVSVETYGKQNRERYSASIHTGAQMELQFEPHSVHNFLDVQQSHPGYCCLVSTPGLINKTCKQRLGDDYVS